MEEKPRSEISQLGSLQSSLHPEAYGESGDGAGTLRTHAQGGSQAWILVSLAMTGVGGSRGAVSRAADH